VQDAKVNDATWTIAGAHVIGNKDWRSACRLRRPEHDSVPGVCALKHELAALGSIKWQQVQNGSKTWQRAQKCNRRGRSFPGRDIIAALVNATPSGRIYREGHLTIERAFPVKVTTLLKF
jgi:hypothetical protein